MVLVFDFWGLKDYVDLYLCLLFNKSVASLNLQAYRCDLQRYLDHSRVPSLQLIMFARIPALLVLSIVFCLSIVEGYLTFKRFTPPVRHASSNRATALRSNADGGPEESKLSSLGFSEREIQRSRGSGDKEPIKVKVSIIPDVDPVTLTAIGFSLIAINFFILGNLGDGGISGFVATIINMSKQ
jgi:hypothetical protein